MQFEFNKEEISPKRAAELFLQKMNDTDRKRFKNMLTIAKQPASNVARYYNVNYEKFIKEVEVML